MAKGFDELVDFLLDEVALKFTDGASLDDFKDAVRKFYDEPNAQIDSDKDIVDGSLISKADRQLQEKAWTWLLLHSDIWVGRQIDADSPPEILVGVDQDASSLSLVEAETLDAASTDDNSIRLWTSHERVWQTVAGHGVDFKRIPGEQFRLLCLIAGAGPKGIAQPELVRLSKQDKKSVPGRTDDLHKNGYIRKSKVLVLKHNTSLLVLRRFLAPEDAGVLDRPVFSNGSLSFANLLGLLKEKLKNGAAMKMSDLEDLLNCSVKSWEKRALWRALERLDIIGVIQRFRSLEWREGVRGMRNFKTKFLRMLREPTEDDLKKYVNLTFKDREAFRRRLEAQDEEAKKEHEEFLDGEEDYAPVATTDEPSQGADGPVVLVNSTPQMKQLNWNPDLPWTNTVFNVIDAAGVNGLSTMRARAATYGHAFERPLEQMLSRLTDAWQMAQPAHLRHFNLVRDTAMNGRATNYLYRTYDAFQEAVDRGDTVWENANDGKPYIKDTPQLDEFGFDVIDSKLVVKKGSATLAQCLTNAQPSLENTARTDPILEEQRDGTLRVVWNHNVAKKRARFNQQKTARIVAKGLQNGGAVEETATADIDAMDIDDLQPDVPARRDTQENQSKDKKRMKEDPPPPELVDPQRIKAEEMAYHEALAEQKNPPPPAVRGKVIDSVWKSGSGRRKIILVDDTVAEEEAQDLPKFSGKRMPVIVVESRVRELFERAIKEVPGEGEEEVEEEEAPRASEGVVRGMVDGERKIVVLKSGLLRELVWFAKESAMSMDKGDQENNGTMIGVGTGHGGTSTPSVHATGFAEPTTADAFTSIPPHNGERAPTQEATSTLTSQIRNSTTPQAKQRSISVDAIASPSPKTSHKRGPKPRSLDALPSKRTKTGRPRGRPRKVKPVDEETKAVDDEIVQEDSVADAESQAKPQQESRKANREEPVLNDEGQAPSQQEPPQIEQDPDAPEIAGQDLTGVEQDLEAPEDGEHEEEQSKAQGEVELKTPETTPRKDWSQRRSNYVRPPPANHNRRKKGTLVGRGTAMYKRTLIVEQILEKCGGIYPGDSEIVPAYQWLQKQCNSESISDRDTIMKAVKSLVDNKKLLRIAFYFHHKGKLVNKWILTKPGIPLDSPEIVEIKERIEGCYPKNYIPHDADGGESTRPKQGKNIDRFQYQPGKSVVQPEGTEWIIDVKARQAEMERQRLAIELAKQKEELKRLRAQAARNKERLAAQGRKPRQPRPVPRRTAMPDYGDLDYLPDGYGEGDEELGDIMPSIEMNRTPATVTETTRSRARYRDTRPEFTAEGNLDFSNKSEPHNQLQSDVPHEPFVPPEAGRARPLGQLVHSTLMFRRTLGPESYDPFYELQDITSLFAPKQRFHPNSGTFSTDFFVRTNVRTREWIQPSEFRFQNHGTINAEDVELYKTTDDNDNYYPDKKVATHKHGAVSRTQRRLRARSDDDDDDSDVELDPALMENQELEMMREQYPGLVHEKPQDGFANLTLGHGQSTAKELYQYGIKPMEHIVLHGASLDEMPRDIEFGDRTRRPIPNQSTELDHDLAYALPPVPRPLAPLQPRIIRKGPVQLVDYEVPVLESPTKTARITSRAPLKQSGDCFISPTEARRLLFACIAVRCLSGELDGTIRWPSVFAVFADHPNLDIPTFKARWLRMHHNYRDVIERVQREFQDAFLLAYEKGELPALDILSGTKLHYKDTKKWIKLVDWAVRTIPVFPNEISLPARRDLLDEAFEFKTAVPDYQELREKMEHQQATNSRREEIAHGFTYALPLRPAKRENKKEDEKANNDLEVAKSWARANCATLEKHYDKEAAHEKLKKLNPSVLNLAVKQLHADKVIAHSFKLRNKMARNYHLSDQYTQIFNKRPLEAQHFSEAVAFKKRLDDACKEGNRGVRVGFIQDDGAVMALMEMLAAKRIHITPVLPPINSEIGAPWPRLTVWGFAEGHYKLRNMDKKIFLWDMEITPTSSYIFGPATFPPPPPRPAQGDERIPVWFDIHGNLVRGIWANLVRCVVQHVAMKAGSELQTITAPYKGCVWEWEIRLLVQWLVECGVVEWVGAVESVGEGVSEGRAVRAKEWWWCVVPEGDDGGSKNDQGATPPLVLPLPKRRRGSRREV